MNDFLGPIVDVRFVKYKGKRLMQFTRDGRVWITPNTIQEDDLTPAEINDIEWSIGNE